MTARFDLGDGDCSDLDRAESVGDMRLEENNQPSSPGDAHEGDDVDSGIPVRSPSPSTISSAFPIVHKRPRNGTHAQNDELMANVKAGLIQEREFRITERERAERERQETRERREEEARTRAYERDEERKRRQEEREEAEKQREESRKNRDAIMQAL